MSRPPVLTSLVLCAVMLPGLAPRAAAASPREPLALGAVAGYPTGGSAPMGVSVADVDGDGFPDVVAPNEMSRSVAWLRNDGTGRLGPPTLVPVPGSPNGATVADVDLDGLPDLVAVDSYGLVTVVHDVASAGAWRSSVAVGGSPFSVSVADATADGLPDLFVDDPATSQVHLAVARAGGGYDVSTTTVPVGSFRLSVGDLDSDGRADAVVSSPAATEVLLARDGRLVVVGEMPEPDRFDLQQVVADVDGDGHLDILQTKARADVVEIRYGRGDGTFASPVAHPAGPGAYGLTVSDVDHDGVLDLVTTNDRFAADGTDQCTLGVLYGLGQRAFSVSDDAPLAIGAVGVVVHDLDVDGVPDVVAPVVSPAGVVRVQLALPLPGPRHRAVVSGRGRTASARPAASSPATLSAATR